MSSLIEGWVLVLAVTIVVLGSMLFVMIGKDSAHDRIRRNRDVIHVGLARFGLCLHECYNPYGSIRDIEYSVIFGASFGLHPRRFYKYASKAINGNRRALIKLYKLCLDANESSQAPHVYELQ